jgi:hypothetical protein
VHGIPSVTSDEELDKPVLVEMVSSMHATQVVAGYFHCIALGNPRS